MQSLPHHYRVETSTRPNGLLDNRSDEGAVLQSAPPVPFGGPGGQWSPEHLLTAAVSGCFILTFKAIASASKLGWQELDCQVEGTLDKVERKMQFTGFTIRARLIIEDDSSRAQAVTALQKAEANCLVSNSLNCPIHLHTEIHISP